MWRKERVLEVCEERRMCELIGLIGCGQCGSPKGSLEIYGQVKIWVVFLIQPLLWIFVLSLFVLFMLSISSVQFSYSILSDSLRLHESQHARPPCPSPTPRVHSELRPSSQWCHPGISSSVVPLSSCPKSLPASKSSPMSQLFAWGGQSTGASALASFLPKQSLGWSPSEWTGWISLQSKGLSRVFSNITVQTHQFFGAQPSSQSNSHIHTWLKKNHSLD